MLARLAVAVVMTLFGGAAIAQRPPCGASDEFAHALVAGEVSAGEPAEHELSDQLTFALEPIVTGWRIEVRDSDGERIGLVSAFDRPAELSPRWVSNWNFLSPPTGGAVAPSDAERVKALPRYLFRTDHMLSALLDRTMVTTPAAAPRPRFGRLEMAVLDFAVDEDAPGDPVLTSISYSACLEWAPMENERYIEGAAAAFPAAVRERFAACGLDRRYALSNHLAGDRVGRGASYIVFEGDYDEFHDIAAPIVRLEDGVRGVAICRGGGRVLNILGIAPPYDVPEEASLMEEATAWALQPTGPTEYLQYDGEPFELFYEGLLFTRPDGGEVLIFFDTDGWGRRTTGDVRVAP